MSIQRHKVSSHPLPPLSLFLFDVLEIGRQIQYKGAQPIGEIFRTASLSLCGEGWIADY
jgi:hypothetical protein